MTKRPGRRRLDLRPYDPASWALRITGPFLLIILGCAMVAGGVTALYCQDWSMLIEVSCILGVMSLDASVVLLFILIVVHHARRLLWPLPSVGIDFRAADLRDREFTQANLARANLSGCDLRGVHFDGADLRGANLCGCDLRGANLRGANLLYAHFFGACVEGADFTEAVLPNGKKHGTQRDR